ncbi:MAG: redox-regulated ATPase YchF [Clostridia bacterium]
MKLGVVGLPNVGKSTLFNAMTKAGAESANYAFCTIDPNVGIVAVPDKRLDALAEIYHPEKYTPATIEFVDIAGLVRGASKGEGLGNKFLSHIREVDAIVHVVRCFDGTDILHVEDSIDPVRDLETINTELILSDIEILERRIDRVKKQMKGDPNAKSELEVLEQVNKALNEGKSAREIELDESSEQYIRDAMLLSAKPVIYVANVSEETLKHPLNECSLYAALEIRAKAENAEIVAISAEIEAELSELDDSERKLYLEDMFNGMGLEDTGLNKLIRSSYKLLGLISFLTAGPKEVRAWTIKKGTKAPGAAGKIHTDFERGFIRAEIVSFDDLILKGSFNAAKELGLVRSEGKDYVMKDGDVVLFRFNV